MLKFKDLLEDVGNLSQQGIGSGECGEASANREWEADQWFTITLRGQFRVSPTPQRILNRTP